jgi:hypothetical protein
MFFGAKAQLRAFSLTHLPLTGGALSAFTIFLVTNQTEICP